MLGGILAAALKGGAEGYSTYAKGEMENQQKLDYQTQLLKMQEEKDLRVDEITRTRNIEDIGRKGRAEAKSRFDNAIVNADADALAEFRKYEARNKIDLPAQKAAYEQKELAAQAPVIDQRAKIEGKAEGTKQTARTSAPGYLSSVAAETGAKESSGSKAQAGLATFQLTQLRAVADLRKQLSELPADSPERERISQQIQDLQLGSSTKSYSDVVTAAESYRKMADNLRKDADKADSEDDRKAKLRRADDFEAQADFILRGAIGKRLPGSAAAQPKPAQSAQSTGAAGAASYKEGDIVNLKNGGRGKVVMVDGKLMVQPL